MDRRRKEEKRNSFFTRSFSIKKNNPESSKQSGIIIHPPTQKGLIINPELREAVVGSFTGSIQREKDMVEWMAKSLDFIPG